VQCSAVQCTLACIQSGRQPGGAVYEATHGTRLAAGRTVSSVQCSVQCSAVQCSALQCSAVQCRAVQCSAAQCSAVQCSAVQCSAVQCSAVDRLKLCAKYLIAIPASADCEYSKEPST
jgi:hypothetical protein